MQHFDGARLSPNSVRNAVWHALNEPVCQYLRKRNPRCSTAYIDNSLGPLATESPCIMGSPSYMRYFVDWNVVMRHIPTKWKWKQDVILKHVYISTKYVALNTFQRILPKYAEHSPLKRMSVCFDRVSQTVHCRLWKERLDIGDGKTRALRKAGVLL